MPHKDPQAKKAYQDVYRAKRREKAKQTTAQWRNANPDKAAASTKAWREKNAEKLRAYKSEYREKNRDSIRATQAAWRDKVGYNALRKGRGENARQQLRLYGLTQACYDDMLMKQGGGCAICKQTNPGMKNSSRLYVDHCHVTNRVRGLLCRACNTMLGAGLDRPEILRTGALYLERFNDSRSAICGSGGDVPKS